MYRPTRIELHMQTALAWADRALCSSPNRQVGCVITDRKMTRILAFGYNGPAKNLPETYCRDWKIKYPEWSGLSRCPCIHAEVNAIAKVQESLEGAAMFITLPPCEPCAHLIVNTGIDAIYYTGEYSNDDGVKLLVSAGKTVCLLADATPAKTNMFGLLPDNLPKAFSYARGQRQVLKQRLTSVVEDFLKDPSSPST